MEHDGKVGIVKWLKFFGAFSIALSGFALFFLYTDIFLPFLIAFIIAYVLNPVVDYVEGRGLSRTITVIALFIFVLITIGLFLYFVFPLIKEEVVGLWGNIPRYIESLKELFVKLEGKISQFAGNQQFVQIDKVFDNLNVLAKTYTSSITKNIARVFSSILTILSFIVILPFITFFLLKDGRDIKKAIIKVVPNRYFEMGLCLWFEINKQIGNYLRGTFIESLIIGVLSTIALLIVGIPYAIPIGLFIGLTNIIPYVGPLVGAIPAVIVAFTSFQSFKMALAAVAVFAVQLIDNVVVKPLAIGKSMDQHPIVILFAVIIGAKLFGLLGMLIAVPAICILSVTFKTLYDGIVGYRTYQS